jgi:hypothetical protein
VQIWGRAVKLARCDLGTDQNICVDGPHASAPIDEIKQAITVKKIYAGELFGLPAPQAEPATNH